MSPAGVNSNPLQYSSLGKPMDVGAWQATVQGVAKSQTRLSDWAYMHASHKCMTLKFNRSGKENLYLAPKLFPIIWYKNRNISWMLKIEQVIEEGLKGDKWFDWKGKFILSLIICNPNLCKTSQEAIFILSEINQSLSHQSLSSWMFQSFNGWCPLI